MTEALRLGPGTGFTFRARFPFGLGSSSSSSSSSDSEDHRLVREDESGGDCEAREWERSDSTELERVLNADLTIVVDGKWW